MLRRDKAHVTSDDKPFLSLEDAKVHEIELLMNGEKAQFPFKLKEVGDCTLSEEQVAIFQSYISEWIMQNGAAIANVLTTTKHSRPGGRKVNGGTKKQASKAKTNPGPLPAALQL
jgi:hypothetical protein